MDVGTGVPETPIIMGSGTAGTLLGHAGLTANRLMRREEP
jgi:hypothetical protein